jgi:ABC-2 type transport system ATP-binding protein
MCSRVLVLEKGLLGYDGPVDEGIKYLKYDDGDEDEELTDEEAADDEMGADV